MPQATAVQSSIQEVRENLQRIKQRARRDIEKIADPKAQALLETTAEVIQGLEKAFTDYEAKSEPAWR
ncbi:MAG: hypothetical protein LAO79_23310 [Acidobacteriia bacterium]|nr:hypothetical protein [Terriglobia bacterium]